MFNSYKVSKITAILNKYESCNRITKNKIKSKSEFKFKNFFILKRKLPLLLIHCESQVYIKQTFLLPDNFHRRT